MCIVNLLKMAAFSYPLGLIIFIIIQVDGAPYILVVFHHLSVSISVKEEHIRADMQIYSKEEMDKLTSMERHDLVGGDPKPKWPSHLHLVPSSPRFSANVDSIIAKLRS